MTYRLHPNAQTEHFDAVVYYESQRKGLGTVYLDEFEATMNQVVKLPLRYRIERKPNIRVVSMNHFPYKIIFRDVGDDIQVLAVSHKRRRPEYWLGRI